MKIITLLFFISCIFAKSQCNLNDLTLNFLGKKYFEVNNKILSDPNIFDVNENMAIDSKRKIPDYKTDYDYVKGDHYQKFISFKYKLHNCFSNSNRGDFVKYNLKLIDNIVYKISVEKIYSLSETTNLQDDYSRFLELIKKKYPILTDSYNISNKFNITLENKDGDSQITGSGKTYMSSKINSKIWKVTDCDISIKTDYSYGKFGGYSYPATGELLEIKFVNLNNTVLDNRGY